MRLQLIVFQGRDIGYNLVPEDHTEAIMLRRVQKLNFLASNKGQRLKYDGISLDTSNNVSALYFLQHRYAILPQNTRFKQELLQVTSDKIKETLPPQIKE